MTSKTKTKTKIKTKKKSDKPKPKGKRKTKTIEAFNKEKQALEAQVRQLQVKNILSVVPFKTEEKRTIVLEGLVNSNLTIDEIKEIYEEMDQPKSTSSSKQTKLPQKSTYIT